MGGCVKKNYNLEMVFAGEKAKGSSIDIIP